MGNARGERTLSRGDVPLHLPHEDSLRKITRSTRIDPGNILSSYQRKHKTTHSPSRACDASRKRFLLKLELCCVKIFSHVTVRHYGINHQHEKHYGQYVQMEDSAGFSLANYPFLPSENKEQWKFKK